MRVQEVGEHDLPCLLLRRGVLSVGSPEVESHHDPDSQDQCGRDDEYTC